MAMETYKFQELSPEREKIIRDCFEETWSVYPNGTKENHWHVFYKAEIDRVIPAEILKAKYIEYVNSLLPFQNDKFTKKEHVIESLVDFIYHRKYLQEHKPPQKSNPQRDKYLYG